MPSSVSSFGSLDLGMDDSLTGGIPDGMQHDSGMGYAEEPLYSTPAYFFPENTSESTFAASSSMSVGPTMAPAMDRLNSGPIISGATLPAGRKVYAGIHQEHAYQQQQALLARQKREAELKAQASMPEDPNSARISKLLESMKAKAVQPPNAAAIAKHLPHIAKLKKEEDEMDEDERLLASEEGKKLTSKERRQLRNKVSARAFRSRRKEYIGQLENEVEKRTAENLELKDRVRGLEDENAQLQSLTRTLLSSPAFSAFLDAMAPMNEEAAPQPIPQPQQQMMEAPARITKDVNPNVRSEAVEGGSWPLYSNNNNSGMWNSAQVYAVTEVPEVPNLQDLSGKLTYSGPALSFASAKDDIAFPAPCDGFYSSEEEEGDYEDLENWDDVYYDYTPPQDIMDLYEQDCEPVEETKAVPMHPAALEKFLASVEDYIVTGTAEGFESSTLEDELVVKLEEGQEARNEDGASESCAMELRSTSEAFNRIETIYKRVGLVCGM